MNDDMYKEMTIERSSNDRGKFMLEKRLLKLDPDLHRRFRDTVFIIQKILDRTKVLFPEYTDHTTLHCMTVIDFCNLIIGPEQINRMNADEIYVLLSASYLHDSGMGITEKDFYELMEKIPYGDYFETHEEWTIPEFVRDFHNEFSGLFIKKYAAMFDIVSDEHLFAIVQVSRGHRRTDLFDPVEYPPDFTVPGGNKVCLPYLAALIRLADEIDVVASRNPVLLYDIELLTTDISIFEHRRHMAIKDLITTYDSFIMIVKEIEDEKLYTGIVKMQDKMQRTLDYCREVAEKRSPYTITQKNVLIKHIDEVYPENENESC
jgi:hypothetical protein